MALLSLTRPRDHVEWIEGVVYGLGGDVPGFCWAVGRGTSYAVGRQQAAPNERTSPLEGIAHVSSITEKEREHHHQR